jgi:hypothetical protein
MGQQLTELCRCVESSGSIPCNIAKYPLLRTAVSDDGLDVNDLATWPRRNWLLNKQEDFRQASTSV